MTTQFGAFQARSNSLMGSSRKIGDVTKQDEYSFNKKIDESSRMRETSRLKVPKD